MSINSIADLEDKSMYYSVANETVLHGLLLNAQTGVIQVCYPTCAFVNYSLQVCYQICAIINFSSLQLSFIGSS